MRDLTRAAGVLSVSTDGKCFIHCQIMMEIKYTSYIAIRDDQSTKNWRMTVDNLQHDYLTLV